MKKNPELLVAVIPDTHFPFHDHAALDLAISKIPKGASHIIQIGDLYDNYSPSRFPRNLNLMTPEKEAEEARLCAWEMWGEIRQRHPHAKLVQIMGNHDDRPFKRAMEKNPELMHVIAPSFRAMYEFKGVETIHDSSEDFETNGIVFTHGYLSKRGDHAARVNMPVVRGHSHKGGVTWLREGLWELDVGMLGDPTAPVFGYSSWKRAYQMTRGMGIIDSNGPRFVPIEPKKKSK
jgi:predicted phosphodiesterase